MSRSIKVELYFVQNSQNGSLEKKDEKKRKRAFNKIISREPQKKIPVLRRAIEGPFSNQDFFLL